MIAHIVCIDSQGNIGYTDGDTFDMPWGKSVKSDLRLFREMTLGNVVIMGSNTYKSIGLLPDRTNIVISRTMTGDFVRNSIEETLKEFKDRDIFIIGGRQIYDATYKFIDRAYITVLGVDYTPVVPTNYTFIKYDTTLEGFKCISAKRLENGSFPYSIYFTEWVCGNNVS